MFPLHLETIEYKFPHTVQETAPSVHKFEHADVNKFVHHIIADSATSIHYHLSSLV